MFSSERRQSSNGGAVTPVRRRYLFGLALAAWCLSALVACPEAGSGGPTNHCMKAYDKCMLPSGVLGICDMVECADDSSTSCLVCRSQH
jgi:hypothetical protein